MHAAASDLHHCWVEQLVSCVGGVVGGVLIGIIPWFLYSDDVGF
jgi:hypothetical protein